jgi:sn-glycerol 3-phosphate transport system substrate-binding protein
MSFSTRLLTIAATGALSIVLSTTGAFADKTKFDFWFGNTGDIAKVFQQVCDNFNKMPGRLRDRLHHPGQL